MKRSQLFSVLVGSMLAQFPGVVSAQQGNPQGMPRGAETLGSGQGYAAPPVNASPSGTAPQSGNAAQQSILRTVAVIPSHLGHVANALGVKYGYLPGVNIGSDAGRGELIILAPQRLHREIDADLRSLLEGASVQQVGHASATGIVSRQFPLRQLSGYEFEDSLQALSGQRLASTTSRNGELVSFELVDQPIGRATVEVDRRANTVRVIAAEPLIPGWEKVIQSIDVKSIQAGQVLEMLRIQNAEPAPIQRALMLLRQLRTRDVSGDGDTVGVAGSNLRYVGTALAPQDPAAPAGQGGGPPVQPGVGPAAPAAEQGNAAGAAEGEEAALIGDVQIQFVPELGVIIARGAKRDVQRVMDVIKEIEAAATTTQPVIEVIQLAHVDNEALATLVRQLYTDILNTRGSSLSITPLVKPNALLLIGRKEAIDAAKELIAKLDLPVAPATQLRVFRLEHASAVDAETTVRNFFSARPGFDEEEQRAGLGTRVRVIADYRTNSLIVQAAPRDLAEVAKLIKDLDVNEVPTQSEIRVFPLRNSLAEDLQPVLQEAITGEGGTTGENENFTRPSTSLSILAVDPDGSRVIDSGLLAGVVVTADTNANALVVRAPSNSMPLIAELIKQLDQLPGAEAVVKVFQLVNSDAASITTALQQLFTGQQQQGGFGGGAGAALNIPIASSSRESSLVQLRFSADARTNSVVAVGATSDLEVVESILIRLDTEGFSERRTEVIWLRNANALAVAEAVQNYVTARQQGLNQLRQQQATQASGSAVAIPDLVDRDLIVVAEPETNMLLLSVSPRFYDNIRRLIDQLDRRPPMIMVKVVLAEVELDDGFEWGVELGLQDSLLFDRGVAGGPASNPGFNFNGSGTPNVNTAGRDTVGAQSLSTFGLGRSTDTFGYGGFVLAAASDSVSLLLRSLHDAGRVQILSRPMVMTRDNTEALVQVGQTVPRPVGVVGAGGVTGVQIQTEDEDVGLILRIVPRVGSDGFIRLDIDTERSSLSDVDGIPIGFDANQNPIVSPIINRTRAQSTIQAYSGQTVIFGGLIQKNRTQFSRRVPYLSSIPILGALFRYDRETESRSELLVVMTPLLVSGDEDLDYIKQEESNRMSYCLADIVEMHGDVGLGGGYGLWGPAVGPIIYPDMTPTVDDIEFMRQQESMGLEYGEVYQEGSSPMVPQPGFPGIEQGAIPQGGGDVKNYWNSAPAATGSEIPATSGASRLNSPLQAQPSFAPAQPQSGPGTSSIVEPAFPVVPTTYQNPASFGPNSVGPGSAIPGNDAQVRPSTAPRPQRIPAVR